MAASMPCSCPQALCKCIAQCLYGITLQRHATLHTCMYHQETMGPHVHPTSHPPNPFVLSVHSQLSACFAERERVSVTNFASTMVTLLVSNPLLPQLDLTCLRLVSCGGSPLPPATVRRAIAAFGCPFFISYGMTECCGKISMSILPKDISQLRYLHRLPFGPDCMS